MRPSKRPTVQPSNRPAVRLFSRYRKVALREWASPFSSIKARYRLGHGSRQLLFVAALLTVVVSPIWMTSQPTPALAQVGGGGGVQLRSPDAGLPNPWEAGMAVNPFTTVNLYNGNACTIIPFVSIDPVGPPLSFALTHNASAAASGSSGGAAPWGFDLGAGWRPAYSANVLRDDANNKATLIEDDGNEYAFALSGGNYTAPAGRFDTMVYDAGLDKYIVTAPDQSVRVFQAITNSSAYRLSTITDSSGNTLTVVYHTDPESPLFKRIDYIKSAADGLNNVGDHRLAFAYDAANG